MVVRRSGADTARHPAQTRGDILTGSGFLSWCQRCQRHCRRGGDATAEAASIMGVGIVRSNRLPAALAPRRWLVARKIRKALLHAAKCEQASADAYALAASLWRGYFGEPGSMRAARSQGVDPNK